MAVNLERNRIVRTVENLMFEEFPLNFELYGRENIETALNLLKQGKKIYNTPDHRSTADSTTGLIASTQIRPWRELIDKSVVVIKDSYFEHLLFRVCLSGVRTIGAVSPSMIEKDGDSNRVKKEMLSAVRGVPGGNSILLPPEVTRVKNGGIQQARKEISLLWHHGNSDPVSDEDVWFLPTADEGTEKQLPNGKLGLPYYFLWGAQHVKVKYFIGEPYRLTDVMAIVSSYDGTRSEKKQLEVDLVMMQVALLHINYGNPDYAGEYYPKLLAELQTKGIKIPNS